MCPPPLPLGALGTGYVLVLGSGALGALGAAAPALLRGRGPRALGVVPMSPWTPAPPRGTQVVSARITMESAVVRMNFSLYRRTVSPGAAECGRGGAGSYDRV